MSNEEKPFTLMAADCTIVVHGDSSLEEEFVLRRVFDHDACCRVCGFEPEDRTMLWNWYIIEVLDGTAFDFFCWEHHPIIL